MFFRNWSAFPPNPWMQTTGVFLVCVHDVMCEFIKISSLLSGYSCMDNEIALITMHVHIYLVMLMRCLVVPSTASSVVSRT